MAPHLGIRRKSGKIKKSVPDKQKCCPKVCITKPCTECHSELVKLKVTNI